MFSTEWVSILKVFGEILAIANEPTSLFSAGLCDNQDEDPITGNDLISNQTAASLRMASVLTKTMTTAFARTLLTRKTMNFNP